MNIYFYVWLHLESNEKYHRYHEPKRDWIVFTMATGSSWYRGRLSKGSRSQHVRSTTKKVLFWEQKKSKRHFRTESTICNYHLKQIISETKGTCKELKPSWPKTKREKKKCISWEYSPKVAHIPGWTNCDEDIEEKVTWLSHPKIKLWSGRWNGQSRATFYVLDHSTISVQAFLQPSPTRKFPLISETV